MAKKMPVISITGPRQSGKTTLAQITFPAYDYVNLEEPRQREFARYDPKGFLSQFEKGVIIDEPQYVPELFSWIQVISDESKKNGKFILTGSQHFLMLEKVTQSLAGRVSIQHLLPFSFSELKNSNLLKKDYEEQIWKGFYPGIYDRKISPADFFSSYIQSYVERDVRQIVNVVNLNAFQKFLRLCAGRVGQIVNYTSLGNETGIDQKTVKHWVSVLEASFIIFNLQPHYKNFNKRVVKSPKLYFYDTGLACYLLGINSTKELKDNFYKGALFENMLIADIMKNILNLGERPRLYFWRDNTGNEIDCIVEDGTTPKPIEIKAGKTINEDFFKGLNYYNKLSKGKPQNSYLFYGGEQNQKRSYANVLEWSNTEKI